MPGRRRRSKRRARTGQVTSTQQRDGPSTSQSPTRRALPPRAKSTSARPSKPQTRTLRRDIDSLANGFDNLSVTSPSAPAPPSAPPPRISRARAQSVPRQCKTVEDIARVILSQNAKNVIVMVGAGLSTPSGIPDFRTPGTGLYDNLQQYRIPVPQAIFDIDYFESHPKPFYTLAKELYPSGKYRPNYAHYFIRLLHDKGLLLRVYTQNIDGLERMAGVPPMKIVEAHGTFLTSSCIKCSHSHPSETVKNAVFNDKVPRCNINRCMGLVKPNIVFFGEDLPRRFYYYLRDFPQADLLFVMGTSLEVEPFAGIVDASRFFIPRILFNREAVGPFKRKARGNDVVAKGDLIRQIQRFVSMLGWTEDMNDLIQQEEVKKGYPVPYYDTAEDSTKPATSASASTAQSMPQPQPQKPGTSQTPQANSVAAAAAPVKKVVPNRNNNSTPWGVRTTAPKTNVINQVHKANRSAGASEKQKTEIVAIKNMMRLNSLQKSASTSNLLPKIPSKNQTQERRPFHAQRTLFRTTRVQKESEVQYFRNGYESEESSATESGDSSSESDDD